MLRKLFATLSGLLSLILLPKINVNDATYTGGTIGVRGGFGNSVSFDNISLY